MLFVNKNPYLEKLSEEINTLSNRLKFRIISEPQEWHDNNDCRPLQAPMSTSYGCKDIFIIFRVT
jgi:hypothetical protein